MIGKGNLFAAANLAVFSGLAAGLALRGNDEMGWELTLALLGSTANLAYLLLSFRKEKAADTRRKAELMEELRQEAEERKERRIAERN